MTKASKRIASATITLIAWTVLGGLIGTAIAYGIYVKQPATFESVGVVQLARPSDAIMEQQGISEPAEGDPAKTTGTGLAGPAGSALSEQNLFLTGLPVVTRAVSVGQLHRIPELAVSGTKPNEVARLIVQSNALTANRIETADLDETYEVRYRANTPTTAERVVQSVMEAAEQRLTKIDTRQDWQELTTLLRESRASIATELRRLDQELKEHQSESNDASEAVAVVDGNLKSKTAEIYRQLREEAYQLQSERAVLGQRLRKIESMIREGAPRESILATLNVPLQAPQIRPPSRGVASNSGASTDEARQRQLQERLRLEREIESKVRPLVEDLEQLLERLGDQHPTVVYKRAQIAKLREPLSRLPSMTSLIEGTEDSVREQPAADESAALESAGEDTESDLDEKTSQKVLAALRSLRREKQSVDAAFSEVTEKLGQAADQLARQESDQQQEQRLVLQIEQQQKQMEQVTERLKRLSDVPPFPTTRLAILRPASEAEQVAPDARAHLTRGASIGMGIGLAAIVLLMLTSLAATGE